MTLNKTTKQIGDQGEDSAEIFLVKQGYEVLERNYRYARNEIDLICLKKNLLVFVEVKFRKNASHGFAEDFVDDKKMERLRECAEHYMEQINWQKDIRFDVLAVTPNRIDHFKDV